MHFERIEPNTVYWDAYYANHLYRYKFAEQLFQQYKINNNILDVACGVGFGSHYFASKAYQKIFAVDINDEALNLAKKYFNHLEINYIKDDCTNFCTLSNELTFNAVVSFETLEHLSEPDKFIQNIYDKLSKDGIFIISTPNINETKHYKKEDWTFHEKEYTASEFIKMLQDGGFTKIQLFGQHYSEIGKIRNNLRHELHIIATNPFVRLGRFIQKVTKGIKFKPILPEQLSDFEIKNYSTPIECDSLKDNLPFALIAVATKI